MSQPTDPSVPVLETQRLRLRGFGPADVEAHAAIVAHPEVMRYLGPGQPLDRHGSWMSLASEIGHWTLRGYGTFAVVRRDDATVVGRVGLWNPEGWPGCELAWTMGREHWGRGYATEAAIAVRDWAFGALGLPSLCSLIHPENAASKRVAAKIGGKLLGDGKLLGFPVEVWRHDRPRRPTIAPERPDGPEAAALLEAADALSRALYPPESNHLLDAAALAAPDVRFFVARLDGRAVGCGALRIRPDHGEIKRMFVAGAARGRGVGDAVLGRLEEEARGLGLGRLMLETGIHNHAALRLYGRHGFVERGPFGEYGPDPLSVFMEKELASSGPGTG